MTKPVYVVITEEFNEILRKYREKKARDSRESDGRKVSLEKDGEAITNNSAGVWYEDSEI